MSVINQILSMNHTPFFKNNFFCMLKKVKVVLINMHDTRRKCGAEKRHCTDKVT